MYKFATGRQNHINIYMGVWNTRCPNNLTYGPENSQEF